jgi:hypothetical protein
MHPVPVPECQAMMQPLGFEQGYGVQVYLLASALDMTA